MLLFRADGGAGAVAGDHHYLIGQPKELGSDGVDQLVVVSAGQVSAPDAALEERVAGEQQIFLVEVEADAAGGVAGGFNDGDLTGSQLQRCLRREVDVGCRGGQGLQPVELRGLVGVHGQRLVLLVDQVGGVGIFLFQSAQGADMVKVSMGMEKVAGGEVVFVKKAGYGVGIAAGVNDNGIPGRAFEENGTVCFKRTNGKNMILQKNLPDGTGNPGKQVFSEDRIRLRTPVGEP